MPSSDKKLRTGYTTGTCASAAAKAGIRFLLTGKRAAAVDTPLPDGNRLAVPIERLDSEGPLARVTVIKDGGDDPDATHGAEIQAVVGLHDMAEPLSVLVEGGRGVGRVTLPGLPVPVGEAAINPAPRAQIERAVLEGAEGLEAGVVSVLVEVPEGEALAHRTMNLRLGIVGGISILGTHGIVKPYSHDSWKASIAEALDVARAQGLDHVVFTTGRRSEKFYLEQFPETPKLAMVQAADFFEFSMRSAAEKGFGSVSWALFFGKLVKHAQGLAYTHAKTHPVDFGLLAGLCAEAGAASDLLPSIEKANTARQVLEMFKGGEILPPLLSLLKKKACAAARGFAGREIDVRYVVFDFDASELTSRN
ncbi:cobalt-precorrin-5B (C(1))-methyltransferase CbiD [Salidesulfovibrio onnuriiensis]|uniref:cobalt-precorrin-5B (C(1))-methyltransferase CbiD n=1 Tax=Salidesulfovibrio onnuriiensis TaxID=2583823 RepID=UPI0011CAB529|nr:cobalt-precorrin-5B (C(1))-methyltransferase CbiD [Salidesulfovibrio onnuriiensis]